MSSNIQTVEKCLFAWYENLDVTVLSSNCTESFLAIILPDTYGKGEKSKEEHFGLATKLAGNIKEYPVYELVEIFEGGNKVTAHIRVQVLLKDGTEYQNESIYIATFNEDGKIVYLKEFVDSLATSKVLAKLLA
ncbi:hypothetical protein DL96DRAFT_1607037 [Flagelloscypha sp. PMI_526]|nr:hypothetical protein DL96DRAFT_1607037 [Flagelloscypha sp. PMI_526]